MQDSLGGNAKTMIIANVSPTFLCAHETHSTLQFAQRAKHIRNRAVINQDTNGDTVTLQKEIVRLNRCVLVGVDIRDVITAQAGGHLYSRPDLCCVARPLCAHMWQPGGCWASQCTIAC